MYLDCRLSSLQKHLRTNEPTFNKYILSDDQFRVSEHNNFFFLYTSDRFNRMFGSSETRLTKLLILNRLVLLLHYRNKYYNHEIFNQGVKFIYSY